MERGGRLSPRTRTIALGLILLAAALLRLHGICFGLPALNDPDELMFEMGSVRMLSGPTLNPGWFGHPATTTIYLLALVNACIFAVGWGAGWWAGPNAFAAMIYQDPSWVILPGRVAMVVFALWSIWLTWRLARQIAGDRVGLAGAAIMAANPVHIAYSQIIRSDIMATCFMLLVFLAAMRIARADRGDPIRRDVILAALWLALATVTKWPFILSALAVAGAMFLRLQDGRISVFDAIKALAAFGALGIVFGVLVSPFLVLDFPTVVRNLAGERQLHHLGATGGPPLSNAWWYVSGPMLRCLGAAGALLALPGAFLLARQREAAATIAFAFAAFFLMICAQQLIWERWVLPLAPTLAIAAAAGLVWVIEAVTKRAADGVKRPVAAVVCAAVLLPMTAQAFVDARVRLNDTRQQAAAWAYANIRPGGTIMVEHFGFDLLQGPWRFLFPVGDSGCVDVRGLLTGKTQYDQVEDARNQRSNVDYGTLNPARRGTCAADWAILTQADRYRAERAAFPREYAAYAQLIATGRIVATFAPVPGESGGPVIRVVRFTDRPSSRPGALPSPR